MLAGATKRRANLHSAKAGPAHVAPTPALKVALAPPPPGACRHQARGRSARFRAYRPAGGFRTVLGTSPRIGAIGWLPVAFQMADRARGDAAAAGFESAAVLERTAVRAAVSCRFLATAPRPPRVSVKSESASSSPSCPASARSVYCLRAWSALMRERT